MQKPAEPTKKAIRQQLDRILRSSAFVNSDRLGRFLRYTVEASLRDGGENLKEYVIGTEVYDRKPPYDPRVDSIVRTEAGRLRRKLKQYYEIDGKDDQIMIYFRLGSYTPVVRMRSPQPDPHGIEVSEPAGIVEGPGIRLAVLPFIALTQGVEAEDFADGLTDELIHGLTQTEGCQVIGRSSVFQLKGKQYQLATIAREFGVHVLLQGTVRKQGDRFRVAVEVSNHDGFQLWSERFDANATAPFELQERIVAAVISRTGPTIAQIREGRASPGPLTMAVFALVVRGRQLMDTQSPADVQRALNLFEDAVQKAPGYARALSALSDCYSAAVRLGLMDISEAVPMARRAAMRAVELDPKSIEGLCSLGTVIGFHDLNWQEGESYFRRGLEVGGHARTAQMLALNLTAQGRFEEANHFLRLSHRLDPFSVRHEIAVAMYLYLSRQYEALLERDSIALGSLEQNAAHGLEYLALRALAHVQLKDCGAALSLIERAKPLAVGNPTVETLIAEIYALSDQPEQARTFWETANTGGTLARRSPALRASLHLALGEEDACLADLESAWNQRDFHLIWLGVDPRFDRLRSNPAFLQILNRLKFR